MKNIFKILICLLFLVTACNDGFLETKPLDKLSSAAVFTDAALAEAYIYDLYKNVPSVPNKYMKSVHCDDGHRRQSSSYLQFNRSALTPDGIPGWSDNPTWNNLYKSIRKINLFLDGTVDESFANLDLLRAEAKFLRAFMYYYLTSLYGGIPIIDKAYGLDDEFQVPRDSYADCIDFIVKDLDEAAVDLPLIAGELGRLSKGAALSLKSRVLIYAASDLHNKLDYLPSGYSNPELIGYTSGDQMTRYQAAKDAAKAVMDLGIYGLVGEELTNHEAIAKSMHALFMNKDEKYECIWSRFNLSTNPYTAWYEWSGPNGNGGQGNNAVTGNLANTFGMADGTPFDWDTYKDNPYANREPRFYAFVLYDAAPWPRTPKSEGLDPYKRIVFSEDIIDPSTDVVEPFKGIDSRSSIFEPGNSGETRYLCRKLLDPTANPDALKQEVPWRYIRYVEVLFNYSEACIGLGLEDEAKINLNRIRGRAGMPDINSTGEDLIRDFRDEKRREMMFEDQRFFDVRRWLIGPEAYDIDVLRVRSYREKINEFPYYSEFPVKIEQLVLETRGWLDKAYFFPILTDEINKNSKLIQNPSY